MVNKIDAIDETRRTELRGMLGGAMFVSAQTGEGLPELFDRIRTEIARGDVEVTIAVPFSRGDVVSRIHRDGEVLSTDHDAQGTVMRVRVPASMAGELAELRVS